MNNWTPKKLSEICRVNPETRNRSWIQSEIEYIDISSVGTGQFVEFPKRLSLKDAPSRAQRIVRNGDIIVSTVRPNRRSFLYLKETKPETIASTGFAVLRAKENNDSRFLYYLVTNQEFTDYLVSKAEGSAYPAVNPSVFSNADVFVPDYEEQKVIAKILSSLDDKIELNRQMNATLEAMARALFKAWFVDFEPVRANSENRPSESASPEIAKLFPSEFENDIPKGWQIKELSSVLELAYGKALKAEDRINGDIPVYGSNGQVGWHNVALVKHSGIVVGRKGNPGTVVWVDEDFFPIDTTFYVDSNFDLKFLFYVLENLNLPRLSADSAVPGLNRNIACKESIIFPRLEIVEKFGEIVSNIFKKRFVNNRQNQKLIEIRDSLLPRLMSGKIRVGEAEKELSKDA